MRVNDEIYPAGNTNDRLTVSNELTFSNYPAGVPLEPSITYSGSIAEFAPWRNVVICSHPIQTPRYSGFSADMGDQIHRQTANIAQRIALQFYGSASHSGGGGTLDSSVPSMGYAHYTNGRKLVRAMKFNRICGKLRVYCVKIIAGLVVYDGWLSCPYQTYVDTYKAQGYKIVSAWISDIRVIGQSNAYIFPFPIDEIAWTKYQCTAPNAAITTRQTGRVLNYAPECYRMSCGDGETDNSVNWAPVFNCPNVGRQTHYLPNANNDTVRAPNPNALYGDGLLVLDGTPYRYYSGGVWVVGLPADAKIAHTTTYIKTFNSPMAYVEDETYILKMAATYGIMCLLNNNSFPSETQADNPAAIEGMLIPIIRETGDYMGDYIIGSAGTPPEVPEITRELINGNSSAPFVLGFPENPARIDPNTYTDHIELGHPTLTANSVFNRAFVVNQTNVEDFAEWIYSANDTLWDEILHGLGLMGEQPIQGVISLRLYPFDISAKINSPVSQTISIGRTETPITGFLLANDTECIFDLGECTFFAYNGNFLDYSPYTTAEMYIPFIGKFPIDTEIFMGHTISIKLIADYQTGAATAIVFCDQIPVIYKSGVIGIDIPVTADNAAAYAQNVVSGLIGTIPQIVKGAEGIATGNPVDAIAGTVGTVGGIYNAFARPTQYQTAGATSPQTALYQPLKAYFTIYRPIPAEPANYKNVVGYAVETAITINNCVGWSIFANPDLTGIPATATELEEIRTLLTTGIYV